MVTGADPGRSKSMVMSPARYSDSAMAARRVHLPDASAQMPLPNDASLVSAALSTTMVPETPAAPDAPDAPDLRPVARR
jgi:hypothetical protein